MGDVYAQVATAEAHRLAAEVKALRERVAELEAWKAAVPVDALRYILLDCDIRYAEGADDVIRKWLEVGE